MKKILLAVGLAAMSTPAFAVLNGTYTINALAPASATNYQNVNSAISDLSGGTRADGGPINGPGVIGAVTLRIVAGSGPYNEQVSIPAIIGASAVNTIRLTGNTTRETITFSGTTTTDRQVIKLNGADYIILDSLTLINTDVTYGFGVHITADADFNIVSNSIISVDSVSTSANFCGIAISGATATTTGNNGDDNLVTNNIVYGGYYGYSSNGTNTTTFSQNNSVVNNEFRGFYYYGLRVYEQTNPVVTGNTVHARITGTTAGYGAYLYYNTQLNFSGNKMLRYGNYGIYTAYQNTLAPMRSTVANNMISGSINTTTPYGIYLTTNSTNVDVVYNSVSLTAGNGRCIYILSGSGNTVQNNSFCITGSTTGYALYISAVAYVTTVDYNDYWASGSANFIYIAAAYTPATFVGGGGYNTNSINLDPMYTNPVNDLHLYTAALSNVATNIIGITTDIDGDARPSNGGYDIGADEYTPITTDGAVISLVQPVSGSCASSSATMEVVIRNYGSNAITAMPVSADVTGFVTATFSVNWTGNLAFNQTDTVVLGTINTLPGGTIMIESYTGLAGDQNLENDTLNSTITIIALGALATGNDDTVCIGDSTDLMVNVDGFSHAWYDAAAGGNLVGTGDTINSGVIMVPTTFYVESSNQLTGSLTSTFAGGNGCAGNMFDLVPAVDMTVDSFDIHIGGVAAETVTLYYRVGTYVGNETNAAAWITVGTVNVTGAGAGLPTRVSLGGVNMLSGQTYGFYVTLVSTNIDYTNGSTTYANTELSMYNGVGLCSPFGGTNPGRMFNGTVYYTTAGCPNPVRTPITVTTVAPPVVALGPDTAACNAITLDAGNPGETFAWSTGDVTQTTVAATSGAYSVGVTNAYCPTVYDTMNFTLNPAPTLSVSSAFGIVCEGSSDTLMVSGASTYSWSSGGTAPTETVTPPGSMMYYVTGIDSNGCSNTDSIMVNVNALPNVTLSLPLDTFCLGTGNVMLSGESPVGGTFSGTAVTGNMFNVDTAGTGTHTITYMYTDTNGCASMDSQMVFVDPCLFVNEISENAFVVYPNPNNGTFTISLGEGISEMKFVMYNSLGAITASFTLNTSNTTFVNDQLAPGIYLLIGENEAGAVTKMIVVE